jgi:peptidoglycan hydrolase-like protein with peptidoglycan-binding domain
MRTSLAPGAHGGDVGALHQALLEAGEAVDPAELSAQSFGPSTELAVRDFQQHHVDGMGHALGVDGLVGPKTWVALLSRSSVVKASGWAPTTGTPATAVVCQAAIADIGRKEQPDGSNDGPDLAKFNTQGQPWCALAVSTWWACAAAGSPFGRRAAVASLVDWARAHGAVVAPGDPAQPGDLACWLRAGGHGHVGLVVGVSGPQLSTVEGNCSNSVRGCVRDRATLAALIRPLKE